MTSIGLLVTDPDRFPAADTMLDAVPLRAALEHRGVEARIVDWADATVDWTGLDLVVIRSPWDYSERPAEFDAWLDRAGALTRILNEPALVLECENPSRVTLLRNPHVLILEYSGGATIGWHRDKAVFGEVVGIHLRDDCLRDGIFDVLAYQPVAFEDFDFSAAPPMGVSARLGGQTAPGSSQTGTEPTTETEPPLRTA